jgi:hypothetical protein
LPRMYPGEWEDPEFIEWDDEPQPYRNEERCFPVAAVLTAGVGLALLCRPRRHCYPRYYCHPRYCFPRYSSACNPFLSCTPTYVCYPMGCFPSPV